LIWNLNVLDYLRCFAQSEEESDPELSKDSIILETCFDVLFRVLITVGGWPAPFPADLPRPPP
jgi:hypothetical protein